MTGVTGLVNEVFAIEGIGRLLPSSMIIKIEVRKTEKMVRGGDVYTLCAATR